MFALLALLAWTPCLTGRLTIPAWYLSLVWVFSRYKCGYGHWYSGKCPLLYPLPLPYPLPHPHPPILLLLSQQQCDNNINVVVDLALAS